MRVTLNHKIDSVFLNQIAVYAVSSVTDATKAVVYGLMLEDNRPFCILIGLKLRLKPIVLRAQKG